MKINTCNAGKINKPKIAQLKLTNFPHAISISIMAFNAALHLQQFNKHQTRPKMHNCQLTIYIVGQINKVIFIGLHYLPANLNKYFTIFLATLMAARKCNKTSSQLNFWKITFTPFKHKPYAWVIINLHFFIFRTLHIYIHVLWCIWNYTTISSWLPAA